MWDWNAKMVSYVLSGALMMTTMGLSGVSVKDMMLVMGLCVVFDVLFMAANGAKRGMNAYEV